MIRFTDRFTALVDACVLAGALRRNMILSLAEAGFFRPRWSARILDETRKAIAEITRGQTDGRRECEAIEAAFPEAPVTGYETLERALALPDPGDNHVLAAAIAISAPVIVTDNLKDFPEALLKPHAIRAIPADDFLADTIDLDPSEAILALRRMRQRFKNPAFEVDALIHKAEAQGLLHVATAMNRYRSLL